ncbi:MAG TPA: histidinol-phosphate transaminase, partial [Candidatus Binataceae bacterium]|nr:histidinol-phosphate transaminase [Candidatus Binataceae bacterium]
AAGETLRLYPAPRADAFIDAAAKLYDIPREMILAGNGSDELLSIIFRAALSPGDRVAYPLPTYSLYDTLAALQDARVIGKPLGAGFMIPLEGLARERANLTIVCNPNSPCGTCVPAEELSQLARRLGRRLLIIDEAYADFAEGNALGLVREQDNVIVLRSLSKSFSLAGMRLGLSFAQPSITDALLKVKDSYNLNRLAIVAGTEALEDAAWMRRNVERVKRTRALTEERLRALGFEVPPSSANFVLARIEGHDMAPLHAALRRRGFSCVIFRSQCFETHYAFRSASRKRWRPCSRRSNHSHGGLSKRSQRPESRASKSGSEDRDEPDWQSVREIPARSTGRG